MVKHSWLPIQNINNWKLWIWKKNGLLNLLNHELDIDQIYLNAKDPYEAKCNFLINKQESTDLEYLNDSKAFTENSNDMDDIFKRNAVNWFHRNMHLERTKISDWLKATTMIKFENLKSSLPLERSIVLFLTT